LQAAPKSGRQSGKEWIAMTKSASYAQWSLDAYSIGVKLRALRTKKRLTLARLATETGLSTALLSKLETDRMVPTLPTLATISRVYGVGLSHFFQEPRRHTLSITRRAHLEGHERGMEPLRITPLNAVAEGTGLAVPGGAAVTAEGEHQTTPASLLGRGLVAQMIEFPAGGGACISDRLRQTCGLMYVLEGELELDSGGLHEVLHAGDCAFVESDMALAWSAVGKQRCRVLAVFPEVPSIVES
jgi:transcriptional regulator with XRE-family HTH domain